MSGVCSWSSVLPELQAGEHRWPQGELNTPQNLVVRTRTQLLGDGQPIQVFQREGGAGAVFQSTVAGLPLRVCEVSYGSRGVSPLRSCPGSQQPRYFSHFGDEDTGARREGLACPTVQHLWVPFSAHPRSICRALGSGPDTGGLGVEEAVPTLREPPTLRDGNATHRSDCRSGQWAAGLPGRPLLTFTAGLCSPLHTLSVGRRLLWGLCPVDTLSAPRPHRPPQEEGGHPQLPVATQDTPGEARPASALSPTGLLPARSLKLGGWPSPSSLIFIHSVTSSSGSAISYP